MSPIPLAVLLTSDVGTLAAPIVTPGGATSAGVDVPLRSPPLASSADATPLACAPPDVATVGAGSEATATTVVGICALAAAAAAAAAAALALPAATTASSQLIKKLCKKLYVTQSANVQSYQRPLESAV